MKIDIVARDILKSASYITEARKKINKLKELLTTFSDLLEGSEQIDVKKLSENIEQNIQYLQKLIKKAK